MTRPTSRGRWSWGSGHAPGPPRSDILASMQATIHTVSPEGGSALLDDGVEIRWDLASVADSGLRHLRVGQRVSVVLGPDERHASRVWIRGIGPGETIG